MRDSPRGFDGFLGGIGRVALEHFVIVPASSQGFCDKRLPDVDGQLSCGRKDIEAVKIGCGLVVVDQLDGWFRASSRRQALTVREVEIT